MDTDNLTPQEQSIFSAIGATPMCARTLAEKTGFNLDSVRTVLRTLYRSGLIDRNRINHIPGGIGSGSFHYAFFLASPLDKS